MFELLITFISYPSIHCVLKEKWDMVHLGAFYLGASHPNMHILLVKRLIVTSHASHVNLTFSPESNHVLELDTYREVHPWPPLTTRAKCSFCIFFFFYNIFLIICSSICIFNLIPSRTSTHWKPTPNICLRKSKT